MITLEDFKKANTTIEEKIKNYKNFIEKKETKKLYIEIYNLEIEKRYEKILNIILDEEKLYLLKKNDCYIVNADSETIKNLKIFKNMNFKEIDFYIFYVNYLSKKEYEDKKVLVGYNGVDGKKVTMSKFKEDINEIRDSGSTFRN